MARRKPLFSRRIGRFTWDRRALGLLILAAALLAARGWLREHPEHDPWAPLDLRDPIGWATAAKLRALEGDTQACRAVLARSKVPFASFPATGEAACARSDRTILSSYPLSPEPPPTTCAVALALELWKRDTLDPQAKAIFGQKITRIEHLGAYSCRRLYGRNEGPWSEHATGNAIDVSGFVLADGTRISVLRDWAGDGGGGSDKARFLHAVREGACRSFSTVLSPDYNAAHRDHLHLDMSRGWRGVCR